MIRKSLGSADPDQIWSAAIEAQELISEVPEIVWDLVVNFAEASLATEDLREALATCLLEHLLEHHFDVYFTRVEREIAQGNNGVIEIFLLCWKFGQSLICANEAKWDELKDRLILQQSAKEM